MHKYLPVAGVPGEDLQLKRDVSGISSKGICLQNVGIHFNFANLSLSNDFSVMCSKKERVANSCLLDFKMYCLLEWDLIYLSSVLKLHLYFQASKELAFLKQMPTLSCKGKEENRCF